MKPARFFDASTRSAIPSAARTHSSIGLSVSAPLNHSRRSSPSTTTPPDRSLSYWFVYNRTRRAGPLQGHDRLVRAVDDFEFSREDVHDLHEVQRGSVVPDDHLHVDTPARLGPITRERPDGEQTRPRGWEERADCEDDDRRQGQEDDLPASEREACDQEPEGRRGEAARQRRAHLTAPSARGPDPGRPQGPPKSARLGSTGPASG